ncbi:hypothetical protein ACIOD2_41445 [Amycolatopsis sp. NPDC088138]|uniref:hypothetical protein n=1 Tax=Amycolatopsis sp. NPDC088138 TaxID=3363938 RepID=UPI00381DF2E8
MHAVAEVGATSVLYTPLYLVDRYAEVYSKGSETPRRYRDWLSEKILPVIAEHGFPAPDETVQPLF